MSDLLALTVALREQTGRPLDVAGLERMRSKISALTQSEATVERALLKRLLSGAQPDRNRP